jgi:hypothetical protein
MSLEITALLLKSLEGVAKKAVINALEECCKRHGLNIEEELKAQGVVSIKVKEMPKRGVGRVVVARRAIGPAKEEEWLGFERELVSSERCQGLCYNRGLFTQCQGGRELGDWCKKCSKEVSLEGKPKAGTVAERLECGLYEFKDSKGRKPVSYIKFLEKIKKSPEEAIEEARKRGYEISPEHLNKGEKKKKEAKAAKEVGTRGRPKKEKKEVENVEVEDLFAKLSLDTQVDVAVEEVAELNEDEKATKRAILEAERAQKKAEKEQKMAEEKEKAKAEKELKLAQEKAEREQKLAQEKAEKEKAKAEKELKLAEEKEKAKAEKELKLAQEKAEKELKLAEKEKAKAEKEKAKAEKAKPTKKDKEPAQAKQEPAKQEQAKQEPAADTPKKVSVVRMRIDGVEYMKSAENILYNPSTKEAIGIWNATEQKIEDLPEDEEEEEEESDYEDE